MKAVYQRSVVDAVGGWWSHNEPVELEFTAQYVGDGIKVSFTDETKLRIYALRLDEDEIVGCREVAEEAFQSSEEEACRVLKVRQQLGRVA